MFLLLLALAENDIRADPLSSPIVIHVWTISNVLFSRVQIRGMDVARASRRFSGFVEVRYRGRDNARANAAPRWGLDLPGF
jgi:hypothetical protein